MNAETFFASVVGTFVLDELVCEGYASGKSVATLSAAALYDVVAFAASEASSQKWRAEPERDWPWEERVGRDAAMALATEIVEGVAARWWTDPALTRHQVWLGDEHAIPIPDCVSHQHYCKPANHIWTSSQIDGLPSAWWPVLRRGADSEPPSTPRSIWHLDVAASARVFEICTPDDWVHLCDTYPGAAVDGHLAPDWERVACDFDGVHLTVEGLVRAQCVEVQSAHGPVMLDNWDAESTAWLRWSFDDVRRVGHVGPDLDYVQQSIPVRHNPVRRGISALRARRRS